jgi:hypothetical protein
MKFTRGFHGRGNRDPRLPPGQYDVGRDWPVLTAEATPTIATATWTFSVGGLVEQPTTWTWEEIQALPDSTYAGDIHCERSTTARKSRQDEGQRVTGAIRVGLGHQAVSCVERLLAIRARIVSPKPSDRVGWGWM